MSPISNILALLQIMAWRRPGDWPLSEPMMVSLLRNICVTRPQWVKIGIHFLTHWGRVTHICVSDLTIISSDNGLSPGRRQAIIWTNTGILLIGPSGTNFSEIVIGIQTFSFKKMHLKMSSAKWRPFCLGLNVLKVNLSRITMPYTLDSATDRLHSTWWITLNDGSISCHKCIKGTWMVSYYGYICIYMIRLKPNPCRQAMLCQIESESAWCFQPDLSPLGHILACLRECQAFFGIF